MNFVIEENCEKFLNNICNQTNVEFFFHALKIMLQNLTNVILIFNFYYIRTWLWFYWKC